MGVGRAFVDGGAAKWRAHRRAEVALVGAEICSVQHTTRRLHRSRAGGGDGTGIKGLRPLGSHGLQQAGQGRVVKALASAGRGIGAVEGGAGRVAGNHRLEQRPFTGSDRGYGKALAGGLHGGVKQLCPGPCAKALVQIPPALHDAGGGDGQRVALGDAALGQGLDQLGRQALGSAPGAVVGQRCLARRHQHGQQVTAHAGGHGLDHAEHGIGGNGGIDGGTPLLQLGLRGGRR